MVGREIKEDEKGVLNPVEFGGYFVQGGQGRGCWTLQKGNRVVGGGGGVSGRIAGLPEGCLGVMGRK